MFSLPDDIIHPLSFTIHTLLSFIGKLIQLNSANSRSFIKKASFGGKTIEIDY